MQKTEEETEKIKPKSGTLGFVRKQYIAVGKILVVDKSGRSVNVSYDYLSNRREISENLKKCLWRRPKIFASRCYT